MTLSRRGFLRSMSAGAVAGTAMHWSRVPAFEPPRRDQAGGFIRLNNNENAYGPSSKVADAIRSAMGMANRYPFMEYSALIERIASFHGVKPEQVLLGCGSREILRMAAFAFLGNGKQLMQALPTFEAMEHYARTAGSETVSVPLNEEFAHDLGSMLARTSASTTLVYICNPNNPTASLTPRKAVETFISKLPATTHVLIDEAYHHYAGRSETYASFINQPINDDRLIVTRTFSNVYGMAGMRLGYAVASPKVIQQMQAFAMGENVNAIVARAAGMALDDTEGVKQFVKRNADDRQEFFNQAMARMLKPIDSHANFVMMDTHNPAEDVIQYFRRHNILIGRRFPAMDTYIRISLGTPEEMQSFWRAWDISPFA
jgi:histidinol-phosphate aminotransferase